MSAREAMRQHGLDDNVSGVCSLGFGLLFPAYGSFMAIESSGTEDDTQVRTTTYLDAAVQCSGLTYHVSMLQWLVYWLLYSLIQGFEKFAWPVLQW